VHDDGLFIDLDPLATGGIFSETHAMQATRLARLARLVRLLMLRALGYTARCAQPKGVEMQCHVRERRKESLVH
jgi:hypothetical protein